MSKTVFDASIGRRHFLKGALGGAAAAVACPTVLRAADANELNILFPGGTWKDWYEQAFVTPFATQRGIKVVWKTGLGFEPLVIAADGLGQPARLRERREVREVELRAGVAGLS